MNDQSFLTLNRYYQPTGLFRRACHPSMGPRCGRANEKGLRLLIDEAEFRDLDLRGPLPIPVRPLGLLTNNNHSITVTHHISHPLPHNIKVAPTMQLLRRSPMMICMRTMKWDLTDLLLPIPPGPI
jgi:hypothetical protein